MRERIRERSYRTSFLASLKTKASAIKLVSHEEKVAIKIFNPEFSFQNTNSKQNRIKTGIEIISKLKHPNIVPVLTTYLNLDPPAIVFKYINGISLDVFQPKIPNILPEVAVLIVIEILKAIEYAHAKDIVHRDLKPENILADNEGNIFVTDFGLAKIFESNLSLTKQTAQGSILGSPDFMSPEQARGEKTTFLSDLFSVSSIFYFLVTGKRPFTKNSPLATLAAVSEIKYEPPQSANLMLNQTLCKIIEKGLSLDPNKRYASSSEFRQVLENYLIDLGQNLDCFSLKNWIRSTHEITLKTLQSCYKSEIRRKNENWKI
ncbi:MAG: serine/threonine protein kinase [Deltaproteobacteria bacterium]|nr:serine/threonine protein kinase [Deltaproteobacteria bacterium]